MSWGTRNLRKKLRKALRARDGDRCHWCNLPMLFGIPIRHHPMLASIEHLTPRSCGGTNDLTNLALAHLACNHRRNELHQRLEKFERYRAGRFPGIRRMGMDRPEIPPHVQRMIAEGDELSDKITKLGAFLAGRLYAQLGETDQGLMQAQLGAMTAYLSVLQIRIARAIGGEA